jgi:branched-chain amino acid aminotransferase
MPFEGCKKLWCNGKFINFEDSKIHVLSHALHYGSSIFEGERCYKSKNGSAIFRIDEHSERLINSAKIYRMEFPYTKEDLNKAKIAVIKENSLEEAYIRPLVIRGFHSLGVDPMKCPVDVWIAAWKWGKYLGPEALEKGVDVKVSTWARFAPNTFPALAKCGANYMNSQLIKMEALLDGYSEGIALDTNGYVSEGSGENVFIVSKNIIYTPPLGTSILPGITRASIIILAKDLGYQVIERIIPREMLYIADEVFFTGTAAEVTPIRSVDKIQIGEGKRGPITGKLQQEFFDIIEGRKPDKYKWLTYIE